MRFTSFVPSVLRSFFLSFFFVGGGERYFSFAASPTVNTCIIRTSSYFGVRLNGNITYTELQYPARTQHYDIIWSRVFFLFFFLYSFTFVFLMCQEKQHLFLFFL